MFERLFDCAICRREIVDYRTRNGRDRHIAPVCRSCEGYHSDSAPKAGAFMDRRKATQLSALSNALLGEASCKQWENKYGRARLRILAGQ